MLPQLELTRHINLVDHDTGTIVAHSYTADRQVCPPGWMRQCPASLVAMLRCGICGSERLSPLGVLETDNRLGDMRQPRLRFRRPGVFKSRPEFSAFYGRACMDCGVLLPFLGPAELRRLNTEADTLEPESTVDYE
ncbi:hypothetical protein AB0L06_08410 [Spirillospora sp. NPDC052269]